MAVTEPNIVNIKKEIIEIIKSNEELWQEDNHEKGFTAIEFGLPAQNQFKGLTYPICFITNDAQLETDEILGNPIGEELRDGKHTYQFKLIFFDQGATGADVEESLDDLYRKTKQTLKENFRLNKVEGVIMSYPRIGHSFNFGEFEGQPIDGRVIKIKVVAT